MTVLSDETLFTQIRSGSGEAFTTLYRRHQHRVYRFALAMSGATHTAEEVTQEVFLALLERGSGYRPELGSFLPFLMGMARKHVLRALRRNASWVNFEEEHETPVDDATLALLTRAEEFEGVYKALLSLPPN